MAFLAFLVFIFKFFKILFVYKESHPYICTPLAEWSVGQGVKTSPFHGGITGSIPVRSTKKPLHCKGFWFKMRAVCILNGSLKRKKFFERREGNYKRLVFSTKTLF